MDTNNSDEVILEFDINVATSIDFDLPLSTETEIVFDF